MRQMRTSLDRAWEECVKQWQWIIARRKADAKARKRRRGVEDLKAQYMERFFKNIYVNNDCFFCNQVSPDVVDCEECPGRLVDSGFDCVLYDYHYYHHPEAFYKKLMELYKVYKQQKATKVKAKAKTAKDNRTRSRIRNKPVSKPTVKTATKAPAVPLTMAQRLDEAWNDCLSEWKWIIAQRKTMNKKQRDACDVEELKEKYLNDVLHREEVIYACFFCNFARQIKTDECNLCPAQLVDPDFDCQHFNYDYESEPEAFYKKLMELHKIYKTQKAKFVAKATRIENGYKKELG